ncbi:MAG: hypothetical protein ACTSXZ_03835 [Alphaproteobacteria bacterium]
MLSRDELRARLFLRAALPLTKVVREEDKLLRLLTKNMSAVVQFEAKRSDTAAHMVFADDQLEVKAGKHDKPTVSFVFKDLASMNDFFAGKLALPWIKGLIRLDVVVRTVPLLLALKMLMPDADPKEPEKRALKVKLLLYMVTTALSQLNRAGDEQMTSMTEKSPDRIYQWVVEKGGPAAYLRMKNGKTKSGRGVYTRRRPFVLMKFPDIEGAYMVLTSKAPLVEAVKKGYVVTEGAMEYSKEIGLRMQYIEELLA